MVFAHGCGCDQSMWRYLHAYAEDLLDIIGIYAAGPVIFVGLSVSDDMIAPREVGEYMHRHLPVSSLAVVGNAGHCPHMSSPGASMEVIDAFLAHTLR